MVYLSVGCGELCLQIRLSVRWLGVMFAIGFVSLLVGGLCLVLGLSVGGYVITLYLLTLWMVSVLDFFITDLKQSHGF